MVDPQFNVSAEQKKNLEAKAARRAELRAEFQRLAHDPHRHATGQGGVAAFGKFTLMTIFYDDIKSIVAQCKDLKCSLRTSAVQTEAITESRKTFIIVKVLTFCQVISTISYIVKPFYSNALLFRCWIPDNIPLNYVLYLQTFFVAFAIPLIVIDTLYFSITSYVFILVKGQNELLRDLKFDQNQYTLKTIKDFITINIELKKVIGDISKAFSSLFLFQYAIALVTVATQLVFLDSSEKSDQKGQVEKLIYAIVYSTVIITQVAFYSFGAVRIQIEFDTAVYRFNAMKVSSYEHFRPSSKTTFYGLALFVVPVALYSYWCNNSRQELEGRIRRGEVAYRDRAFKFT